MFMYRHEEQRHIEAPPELIFAILSDVAHHDELAGSGEIKAIHLRSSGEVRVGTEWEADEEIKMGRSTQRFLARSTVREYNPPHGLSWTSEPSTRPVPRRIQWWYRLIPEHRGTHVVERVEVDMSPAMNVLMRVPYRFMRGSAVAEGMRRTLDNLAKKAESTHR